ncbi:MAG: pilus assembly protein TadG-related protein, partial [Candidatus Dormibacteraeota bacterium]|nr:pilus assembly protein TadG-related protein [Candidatus Dormibacteraeota bacterium]
MRRLPRSQRGQTLPIFALASLFIIGVVALAVDYGFLTNQHRNLQAFADEGATAGAIKLGGYPAPADRTNARKAALVYLRDNLKLSAAAVNATTVAALGAKCGVADNMGTAGTASCVLPGTTYKVSIWSPAESVGLG